MSSNESKSRQTQFMAQLVAVQADLYRLVASLLPFSPEDVDDVVQNANLDLLAKQESYSPERPFLPFALSFAKTAVRTYILKKSRSRLVFSEEAMASAANLIAEESAISPDNLSTLKRLEICKTHLSERQKKLLDDRYGKKRPVQQIADELGKSNEAVRSALVYIRQRLAECMRSLCRMPDDVFERKFPDAFTDQISQVIDDGETAEQAGLSDGVWESEENLRTVVDQVGVDALLRRYSPSTAESGGGAGVIAAGRRAHRKGRIRRVAAIGLALLLSVFAFAAVVVIGNAKSQADAAGVVAVNGIEGLPTTPSASAPTVGAPPLSATASLRTSSTEKEEPMKRTTSIRRLLNSLAMALVSAFPAAAAAAADPYVESLKANTIFTDYYANPNTRIELDFQYLAGDYGDASVEHGGMVIGPWSSGCGTATALWNAGGENGMQFIVGSDRKFVNSGRTIAAARWFLSIDSHTGKLQIALHGAAATNEVDSGATFAANANWPVSLLGSSKSADGSAVDNGQFAKARIYGCKIYEYNETSGNYDLVRDYVPVLRDGQPCLRDAVTGSFALDPRKGAVALRYGGDIKEVGGGYIQLAATSGTVGLFTGYKMKATSRVELDGALGSASGTFRPMGCWNGGGSTTMRYLVYTASNKNQFFLNNGSSQGSGPAIDTDRHTWVFDAANNKGEYITGCTPVATIAGTAPASGAEASVQLSIFADSNGSAFAQPAYGMKCYGLKIYEGGVLVTNFVPYVRNGEAGFRDTLTGAFLSAGTVDFVAGGNIALSGATARDAFVESDGKQVLNTDYKVGNQSRVEVDVSLKSPKKGFICGNFASGAGLRWSMWINGSTGPLRFSGGSGGSNTDILSPWPGTERMKLVYDMANAQGWVVRDGVEGERKSVTSPGSLTCAYPMGVFGSLKNEAGTEVDTTLAAADAGIPMRVYSVRIYEGESTEPAAEFLPYKGPEGVGLYDTKTGAIALKHSASVADPSIGGMGVDGAERWLKIPAALSIKKSDGAKTLSAAAVGAVAYRWARNGTVIEGETEGELDVVWRKSRTPDVYTVTPVYSVFGTELAGEPLSVDVVNEPLGMTIVLR